eukprot:TCONS_00066243-protein
MASLKNFLKGKKKSNPDKKGSNYHSSTGNLSRASSKGSQLNLAGSTDSLGYILKEKDLPKFLKAAWQGDVSKLKQLTNKKTNFDETDKEQRTALHLACAKGFKPVVEYLIGNGANTNKSDSEGKTPLMKACETNSLQIVDILLRAGAETNIYDANHMTALHISAASGNADIGQMLANRDAKLDAKDMNQVTPLHLACALGHMPFTEFLISEYVQVNPIDNQKRTPLMTACIEGHIDIVQLLLEHDADPEMVDKSGHTAEDLAKQYNNGPISTLVDSFLKKKNKKLTSPSGSSVPSRHSSQNNRPLSPADNQDDLFSGSNASDHNFANIFGGPALNTGGNALTERSEESHSEELGNTESWADTDTDDLESERKSKGPNLNAMMKMRKENENKDKPTVAKKPTSSTTKDSSFLPKTNVTAPKKNKLPWQDTVSDDETESKWDDDDDMAMGSARNRKTASKNNLVEDSPAPQATTKLTSTPKLLTVPKTTGGGLDLDESANSVDFDSSMPDGSFGDLPLSELADTKPNEGKQKISFLKALNLKDDDDDGSDESSWSDSNLNTPPPKPKVPSNVEKDTSKNFATTPKKLASIGQNPTIDNEDESVWDSETELPSSPKQDVKPGPSTGTTTAQEPPRPQVISKDGSGESESESEWDSESLMPTNRNTESKKEPILGPSKNQEKNSSPSKKSSPKSAATTSSAHEKEGDDESAIASSVLPALKKTDTQPLTSPKTKTPTPKDDDKEDNEDKWDSTDDDDEPSKAPSEEMLPPRTPERGSDFEPSTSGDDESDFSLGESYDMERLAAQKNKGDKTTTDPKNPGGGSIFQTELTGGNDFDNSSDDEMDDIEKQMLTVSKHGSTGALKKDSPVHLQKNPVEVEATLADDDKEKENKAKKPLSGRQKQLAELGLDLGSDVSSVSDPDGMSASFDLPDNVPGASTTTKKKADQNNNSKKNPLDLTLSDDEETSDFTETESEWELQQKQKRLSKTKIDIPPPVLETPVAAAKENQVAADKDFVLSEDEDSSDFSFSEHSNVLKTTQESLEEGEDQAEAFLLKQMEVAEANVGKPTKDAAISTPKQKTSPKLQAATDSSSPKVDGKEKLKGVNITDEDVRRRALSDEEHRRREALAKEEAEMKLRLEAEHETRRKEIAAESENKKKEIESETKRRMLEMETLEVERRRELEDLERDLKMRIQQQEKELAKIEAEKDRKRQEVEAESSRLIDLETQTKTKQRDLEVEIDEVNKRLESERQKITDVEKEGKLKEAEIQERLKSLEDEEELVRRRLDESSLLEHDMGDRERLKDSLDVEEKFLREKLTKKLEEEEYLMKRKMSDEYKRVQGDVETKRAVKMQELNDTVELERERLFAELDAEEAKRRRKLSEEGRVFRERLEVERQEKLNEILNQTEEDKLLMQQELESEGRLKHSQLDKELRVKEENVTERMNRMENERLRALEDKEKFLQQKLGDKLRKMEAEKMAELGKKEQELLMRMQDINSEDRFHELETQARSRERELELQLMELRQRQLQGDSAIKEVTHLSAIKAIPVTETVITADNEANVEAGNESLLQEVDVPTTSTANPAVTPSLNKQGNDVEGTQPQNEKIQSGRKQDENLRDVLSAAKHSKVVDTAIQMIGGSQHNYTFDPSQQNARFFRGASTPNPMLIDDSDIGDTSYHQASSQNRRQAAVAYQEKFNAQERAKREMQLEMDDMHRTIEALNKSQHETERFRMDATLELQSIRYKLEQEMEAKTMAERLCNQLKDQLNRSEKKLMREAELKQTAELTNRKMQTEMKTREQGFIKLNADLNELQLQLEAEKNARTLQEEMYQEQLRQHEAILREAQKTSHNHAQAVTKLEMLSATRKQMESSNENSKIELAKTKGELLKALTRADEKQLELDKERNLFNEKIQQKIKELNQIEKNLIQAQLLYENEKVKRQDIETQLSSNLESETNLRKQLDVENASLKNRLEQANREIDRLGDQSNRYDKESRTGRETSMMEKFNLEKELSITQNQLKISEEKVNRLEDELNKASGELKNTGRVLAERADEAMLTQRDSKESKDRIRKLEEDLRLEQLNGTKLETQLDSAREKTTFLKEENTKLQKELQEVRNTLASKEKESSNKNERLADALGNIKERSLQEKTELLLQKEQNSLLIDRLRNQVERHEEQLKESETIIKNLQQNLHKTKSDLESTKTEKEQAQKARDIAEKQNLHLKEDKKHYENQIDNLEKNNQQIADDFVVAKSELSKSMQLGDEANKRLALKSKDFQKLENANFELKSGLEEIKRQNLLIESDLREEKGRAEILLQELQGANEARENLEALLSNVKGNNALLEEKLHNESLHRTQHEREATDNKNLWESEIKSRSRLGVQMIDLEKKIDEQKTQIEEERRKTRKLLEYKKTSDNKIEVYEQRSGQHQKEVTNLRNKLKQFQRKIKMLESGEDGSEQEKKVLMQTVAKLRGQLQGQSEQLKHEQRLRQDLEQSKRDQFTEISDMKTKEKVQRYEVDKLESALQTLQKDLLKQKDHFEKHYIPEESLEEFKRNLETKCRLDLNKKLQEVNMHLEEQSLAREAFDKIRNDKETKTKQELEETIRELKSELNEMRNSLHEGLAKRDTSQIEARRYKDLFENEMTHTEKLSSKLAKTNDFLSSERSRTNYMFEETLNKTKSPVSKKLFTDTGVHGYSPSKLSVEDFDFGRRSKGIATSTALNVSAMDGRKYAVGSSTPNKSYRLESPHKDLLFSSIKRRPLHS